jgi:hypothetical protein
MDGRVDEEVLDEFRVTEEDFRDLDSIVRRHCETVKYYVYRGSTLGGYDTDDVEVLLKERNGSGIKIESVVLRATGSEGLKFNVNFDDTVAINGECEDRARLVLLATETRGLIRDRMKSGTPRQRQNILYAVAAIFFLVGFLGFQQYQNSYTNRYNAAQVARQIRAEAASQQAQNSVSVSPQSLLSQAKSALSKHNLSAEIGVLLQQQIGNWHQEIAFKPTPASSNPPSWSNSFWLPLAVGCAAAAAAYGAVGYVFLPDGGSVFLIGDEKRKQKRHEKFLANIKWVIFAGLLVCVLGGLILTHLF